MKKIIIAILLLNLTACNSFYRPTPFGLYNGMNNNVPEGSKLFQAGWKAGCDSGLAASGPLQYKAMYEYTYDASYIDSDEYHSAWRVGFRYCRWYVAQWTRG